MNVINDIDFGTLYKTHLRQGEHRHKSAEEWDSKCERMAVDIGGTTDSYVKAFIDKMDCSGASTLLDVGCGPGTICLPIANQFKEVYALDFSAGMLQKLEEVAAKKEIHHVHPILKSWEDDWSDVPVCDITVVSRATIVDDLEAAILKLNRQTKQRVYTTQGVEHHFISKQILDAIGRKKEGMPNYIYMVNILQKMGYRPRVDYIDTLLNKPQPENFEQFLQSVSWSLGELSNNELEKLQHYFNAQTEKGLPVTKVSRVWAFVWWDVRETL